MSKASAEGISFVDFSKLIHAREPSISAAALRACFDQLDSDGNGFVDAREYQKEHILVSLLEELARAPQSLATIFERWDKDASGCIDASEWRAAVRSLKLPAFGCSDQALDAAFAALDNDGSGTVTFAELNRQLNLLLAHDGGRRLAVKTRLRAHATKATGTALPPSVVIHAGSDALKQLRGVMNSHRQKVINLFREWDTNGDGQISKKEFRRAMALLSFEAPRQTVDELFDSLDMDRSGAIDYKELVKALRSAPGEAMNDSKENATVNSTSSSPKMSEELLAEIDRCHGALGAAMCDVPVGRQRGGGDSELALQMAKAEAEEAKAAAKAEGEGARREAAARGEAEAAKEAAVAEAEAAIAEAHAAKAELASARQETHAAAAEAAEAKESAKRASMAHLLAEQACKEARQAVATARQSEAEAIARAEGAREAELQARSEAHEAKRCMAQAAERESSQALAAQMSIAEAKAECSLAIAEMQVAMAEADRARQAEAEALEEAAKASALAEEREAARLEALAECDKAIADADSQVMLARHAEAKARRDADAAVQEAAEAKVREAQAAEREAASTEAAHTFAKEASTSLMELSAKLAEAEAAREAAVALSSKSTCSPILGALPRLARCSTLALNACALIRVLAPTSALASMMDGVKTSWTRLDAYRACAALSASTIATWAPTHGTRSPTCIR